MTNNHKIIFSGNNTKAGSIEQEIINLIDDTHFELNIAMYRFLNENILNAIKEKVEEGVKLNMVLDTTVNEADEYADYFFERIAQPLKNLQNKYAERVKIAFMKDDKVMHHKLIISDRRVLITGSYNMTRAAEERNLENIFVYESSEDEKVMADALRGFFAMMGEHYEPEKLDIRSISIRKGIYLNNKFEKISEVYDDEIFIIRGMSLSFWVHGNAIFCIKAQNRYGKTIVADHHFLYDTNVDDTLQINVYGIDGTCKSYRYLVKIMPWKLPYTDGFKNHLNERFNLLTQKLKYAGLI